jgi:hypothetical protein
MSSNVYYAYSWVVFLPSISRMNFISSIQFQSIKAQSTGHFSIVMIKSVEIFDTLFCQWKGRSLHLFYNKWIFIPYLQDVTELCKVRVNYRSKRRCTMYWAWLDRSRPSQLSSVCQIIFWWSSLLFRRIQITINAHVVVGKRSVHPCLIRAQQLFERNGGYIRARSNPKLKWIWNLDKTW